VWFISVLGEAIGSIPVRDLRVGGARNSQRRAMDWGRPNAAHFGGVRLPLFC